MLSFGYVCHLWSPLLISVGGVKAPFNLTSISTEKNEDRCGTVTSTEEGDYPVC